MVRKVLAVDDNHDVLLLLGDALETCGYEAWLAHNGPAALKLIEDKGPPDLLVTDIRMPLMDGRELIRMVVSQHGIPVIALTADHTCAVPEAARVFRKPCDLHALLQAVERLIGTPPAVNGVNGATH